jgi:hypothetical protein
MTSRQSNPQHDAFISHASADLGPAAKIETALEAGRLDVWLDHSEIQLGVLLAGELQDAIAGCRVSILLWSETAAASRWVNTEWLAAHHLDRFILPCVLDDTTLPQCLEHTVHLDLRRDWDAAVARLAKAARAAPTGANQLPPPMRAESRELHDAVKSIAAGQKMVTAALGRRKLDDARQAQTMLDEFMPVALDAWPLDPMIVKLDGYRIKNGYMIRHWQALQSGRAPPDPALEQAERRFFEALWLDPTDPEGLDGLGSMLMLRRDLHAAKFFIECALAQAKRRGFQYRAAADNLKTILRFLPQP